MGNLSGADRDEDKEQQRESLVRTVPRLPKALAGDSEKINKKLITMAGLDKSGKKTVLYTAREKQPKLFHPKYKRKREAIDTFIPVIGCPMKCHKTKKKAREGGGAPIYWYM